MKTEGRKNMNFEDALASLDTLVKKLEGGALTLEESLAVFEEAASLVKLCNGKLEAAEKRVSILLKERDGEIAEKDFGEE